MIKEDLENIAIFCKTEEEAKDCCKLAKDLGWAWIDGENYDDTCWCHVGKKDIGIYYYFHDGRYYVGGDFPTNDKNIVKSAQWFLDNFKNE